MLGLFRLFLFDSEGARFPKLDFHAENARMKCRLEYPAHLENITCIGL